MWPLISAEADTALTRRTREWFHWSSDDATLQPRSRQAPTFTRATTATLTDRWGNVITVPSGVPRWSVVPGDVTSLSPRTALLLERATVNKCLHSNDLTQWTNNGCVLTANARVHGHLALTLVADDNASAVESVYRTVTCGQAYGVLSAYVSAGTAPAASGVTLRLWDVTAGVARGGVVLTWTGGVPTPTAVGGATVGVVQVGPRLWRVWAIMPSGIVTGNSNRVEVLPATTSAQTGDVYIGGVQYEDAREPSSVVFTTASTGTRNADVLTWSMTPSVGTLAWPNAFTVALETARPAHHAYTGTVDVAGGVTVLGNARVARVTSARQWAAYPTSVMSGGAVTAWAADPVQRVVAQFDGYALGGRMARIDAGAGFTGWTAGSSGVVVPTATIAAYSDTNNASDLWLRRLVVVAGLHDFTQLGRLW